MDENLINVDNLKVYFPIRRGIFLQTVGYIKAIDDINIKINKNENISVVGESGSGKTTLGKSIVGLIKPTSGKILYSFNGKTFDMSKQLPIDVRQSIQMIFQDPFSSLNPRLKIIDTLKEPLEIRGSFRSKKEIADYLGELLEKVGLKREYLYRYPHEFSGGQRQRISIVRAISMKSKIIVLDEPTSSLDVSVQSQVLNLLQDIKKEYDLTYIFITHNISVAKYMGQKIIVMYLGKIVEINDADKLIDKPFHPYTQLLLSTVVEIKSEHVEKEIKIGEPPSPVNIPSGCRFRTRCPFAMEICAKKEPPLREYEGSLVACHLYSNEKKEVSVNNS
ncbi:ABC transporter ATP-binding protein [Athalassotoga sp.]|uniref:ABC transporter ATP-binding protein n=1 Tax=Athalassotoga sp. TaxID=2022597 RepID=UPI003CFE2B4E